MLEKRILTRGELNGDEKSEKSIENVKSAVKTTKPMSKVLRKKIESLPQSRSVVFVEK
jgi:hypothetical protein